MAARRPSGSLSPLERSLAKLLAPPKPARPRRTPARKKRRRRVYTPAPFAQEPGLSAAISLPSRGVLREAGERVLAAIEATHRVPVALPCLRLEVTSNSRRVGNYVFIDLNNGKDPKILRAAALKASRGSEFLEINLLHEFGHLFDHVAIGDQDDLASDQGDPRVAPVLAAARASAAFRTLPNAGVRRFRYLAGPAELFARGYAQWVTLRSEDEALAAQMDALRRRPARPGREAVMEQWADEDFAPIADAFDRLAAELGWR